MERFKCIGQITGPKNYELPVQGLIAPYLIFSCENVMGSNRVQAQIVLSNIATTALLKCI